MIPIGGDALAALRATESPEEAIAGVATFLPIPVLLAVATRPGGHRLMPAAGIADPVVVNR
jgi:hypothetical protein